MDELSARPTAVAAAPPPAWAQLVDDVAHPAALLDGLGRVLRANALFATRCEPEGHLLPQARPDLWRELAPLLPALADGDAKPRSVTLPPQVLEGAQATLTPIEGAGANGGANGGAGMLWLVLRASVEASPTARSEEGVLSAEAREARRWGFGRRHHLLAESIPQIVWIAEASGSITYVNRRGIAYLGLEAGLDSGSILSARWQDFAHPDDVGPALESWLLSVREGTPYEVRYRLRGHDGRYRWFLMLALPVLDEVGQVQQWFGTGTDIDGARRSQESLRLLADAGEILTSSLDEARPLQALAARLVSDFADWCFFERVLPGGKLELLALDHSDPARLSALREMRRHAIEDHTLPIISRIAQTGQPELLGSITEEMLDGVSVDARHRGYLEEVGFRSFICVPLRARGQVLGVLSLARGAVSQGSRGAFEPEDLRLAEEVAQRASSSMDNAALYLQAQRALQAAEEAGRAKDSFLATVSHELRTPLTAILGWANLLKSGRADAKTTFNALETIERNVKSQAQIIEDLLDVSRIVAGQLRLEMRPVELASVVATAIEAVRPAMDAKNILLDVSFPRPPAPPPVVAGDPTRLQQIVWNMLSNAAKFTPRGGRIEVSLELARSQVLLTVRDSGPGVPPDFAPYIFDRFRQADSSATRRHGGLGLGLAIVRHLVEMHGGSIRLEPPSEEAGASENPGAVFVVELPLLALSERLEEVRAENPDDYARLMLQGRSVLVVEDEADSRELLQVVLSRFGARVRLAASARAAWTSLGEEKPDVLVSDIGMPEEDGYSLIRRVRQKFSPQELPAIALTAYAASSDRDRALEAGFNAHITKPAPPIHLAMTVAGLLEPSKGDG